jgi:hypothetical protein
MKAKLSQRNIKQIVSGSLIIWLSGIVFLFCCEMPKAQASNAESCPLAKTNHCSKQSNTETVSGFASLQTNQQSFDCCKFLPLVFDKARKIEKTQKAEMVKTIVKAFQPVFSAVNHSVFVPKNFHSVVINRENIHLKNCVFRI